jgi:hypothetical protein
MMRRFSLCLTFFCCIGVLAPGETVDLYLHVQNVEHARAPETFVDKIIFWYESPAHVYVVAARFSHEEYAVLHVFQKNEHGVFFLVLDQPAVDGPIKYRVMVDGVWTGDPANPRFETDRLGVVFSVFDSKRAFPDDASPIVQEGGALFRIAAAPGSVVTLAGDFNGFDPWSHRCDETAPGVFSVPVRLYPGRHYYYFIVDGVRVIDPRNEAIALDSGHHRLSVVDIP